MDAVWKEGLTLPTGVSVSSRPPQPRRGPPVTLAVANAVGPLAAAEMPWSQISCTAGAADHRNDRAAFVDSDGAGLRLFS